jgi:hypothetical protein
VPQEVIERLNGKVQALSTLGALVFEVPLLFLIMRASAER